MTKSLELKLAIEDKRAEVEKLQRAENLTEAKKAAAELTKLVDEYEVEVAKEKSDFEYFLQHGTPINFPEGMTLYNKAGVAGEDYRRKFLTAIRSKFKNNALAESALSDGGYLVPSEFHREIVTALEEENVMRQIGMTITTQSAHRIPIVSTKPSATWVGEGENINFASETFSQVTLEAYKLAVSIKISNELLADSFYPLEAHLTQEFAKAFGRAEEDCFLNGTTAVGATKKNPTGLLPTLETSPTTTITTQGATLAADDLLNLEFSLKRPYRKKACWLFNDSTVAQIRKLKNQTQDYIWQASVVDHEPDRLFGYPVYTSTFMPTLASGNVIALFGDFADFFIIGERGQRVIKPLRELYAMSDQTAFLMLERVDCALTDINAIKALRLQ